MQEYIIYKMADAISKQKWISLYEALSLPESEFWNSWITI